MDFYYKDELFNNVTEALRIYRKRRTSKKRYLKYCQNAIGYSGYSENEKKELMETEKTLVADLEQLEEDVSFLEKQKRSRKKKG